MGNRRRQRKKERHRARRTADGAWDAVDAGRLARGEEMLREALRSHDGDPRLWCDLALVLWKRGRLKEAEKAFRTALLLRPEFAEARVDLCELLAERGFYRQALALLEEVRPSSAYLAAYREKAAIYRRRAEEVEAARERSDARE